jgi:hypothetical protein
VSGLRQHGRGRPIAVRDALRARIAAAS